MNLEVSTGRLINTKDNSNIKCRFNSLEEHSWHTSHSQLNLLVDIIYNFYITWGKRQDDLDLKLERLHKEYKQLEEQYTQINSNINSVLNILESSKLERKKVSQNSDYIKADTSQILKKFEGSLLPLKEDKALTNCDSELLKIKKLVEEVKTLVLS